MYTCKTFLPAYNSAKIILKNSSRFSRVMITNVLPPFYGSQCTTKSDNIDFISHNMLQCMSIKRDNAKIRCSPFSRLYKRRLKQYTLPITGTFNKFIFIPCTSL